MVKLALFILPSLQHLRKKDKIGCGERSEEGKRIGRDKYEAKG